MRQKTPLMEEFEKENPGKHAIWQGEITEQFRIWKEIRLDPSYNPQFLYQGKDGFIIERRKNINYYVDIIEEIIKKYSLSETPDWDQVKHFGTLIHDYINRAKFRRDNDEGDFHRDITRIAGDLSSIDEDSINSSNDFKECVILY